VLAVAGAAVFGDVLLVAGVDVLFEFAVLEHATSKSTQTTQSDKRTVVRIRGSFGVQAQLAELNLQGIEERRHDTRDGPNHHHHYPASNSDQTSAREYLTRIAMPFDLHFPAQKDVK